MQETAIQASHAGAPVTAAHNRQQEAQLISVYNSERTIKIGQYL